MRKIIVAIAAAAAVTTAGPAVAKKGGHGKGVEKVRHGGGYHGFDGGFERDRFAGRGRFCPPGLAKKGCMPPGQAKKLGVGDRLPEYLGGYNLPAQYRDRYRDNYEDAYRYEDGRIYRADRRSGIIEQIISVLGF